MTSALMRVPRAAPISFTLQLSCLQRGHRSYPARKVTNEILRCAQTNYQSTHFSRINAPAILLKLPE
jgi:hypothetical protein